MKNKILIGFVILIIVVTSINIIVALISHKNCKELCQENEAIISQMIPNGEWFSTSDYCVCYYEKRVETFILGDRNDIEDKSTKG